MAVTPIGSTRPAWMEVAELLTVSVGYTVGMLEDTEFTKVSMAH
ncbi:hypothetical protein [uncultured Roseibium sp.]|nr:hypothetical protein [uncultured Roseibium sp.]